MVNSKTVKYKADFLKDDKQMDNEKFPNESNECDKTEFLKDSKEFKFSEGK